MGCMFQDASTYINWEYGEVIKALAKQPPDTSQAAYCFGHLVHTAQDFYAHSNWVEIWRKRGAYRCDNDTNTSSDISLTDYRLYEPGLGKWCNPTIFGGDWHASLDWSLYPYYQGRNATNYNNIIIAQTHLGGYDYIPTGWTATPGTPPNEKVPTIVADRNGDGTPERYDVLITAGSGPKCEYTSPGPVRIQFCRDRRSYNAIAIEHDNRLGKDNSDIANYEDAYWNAVFQTRHEWWRLLNLLREEGARQNRGFDLASAVLGGWLDPAVRYTERKSGSIHVTISSSVSRNGSRLTAYNFLLYRGDFSDYENANGAGPLTLRVAKDDTIVMTVQPEGLTGASLSMKASDVTPGDYPAISRDVQATFHVSVVSAGPATVRHN